MLLLDNRFLRAAPRIFENRPVAIPPVLKNASFEKCQKCSDAQFSFEKPAVQWPPLVKPARGNLTGFGKLSANSKALTQFNKLSISGGLPPYPGLSNHTKVNKL